ncbi:MAG TPA: hypothetical protein VLJ62_28455 [Burkholderiaceae bacterium]|nr:hypothetical protein [Burkholderiaceae bacterium]
MTPMSAKRRKGAKQSVRSRAPKSAPPPTREVAAAAVGDDLDRALEVMASTRRGLLEAQAALRAIQRDSTDDAEQSQAAVELLNVERELALLESRRLALVDGTATLRPPSDADIAEAQRLAGELARVLADVGKVAAIVGLTADIVRLGEKLAA